MALAEKNLPIGTILSLWKLPSGWSENWISCDGQIINEGPYKNQNAPDLNRGQRFLRGGPSNTAGTYQDQDTNMEKLGGTYVDRYFKQVGNKNSHSTFAQNSKSNRFKTSRMVTME